LLDIKTEERVRRVLPEHKIFIREDGIFCKWTSLVKPVWSPSLETD